MTQSRSTSKPTAVPLSSLVPTASCSPSWVRAVLPDHLVLQRGRLVRRDLREAEAVVEAVPDLPDQLERLVLLAPGIPVRLERPETLGRWEQAVRWVQRAQLVALRQEQLGQPVPSEEWALLEERVRRGELAQPELRVTLGLRARCLDLRAQRDPLALLATRV